jgi:mRNA-degrading endonuclease toxin of MazEF toxin-antitoxin module
MQKGQIVSDQIRTIDEIRLVKKLGSINVETELEVISI